MDSRSPVAFVDPVPKLRNLGFVFPQLRLEIVLFVLRFEQLCFGARNFRSSLTERRIGGGDSCFAPAQLVLSCDPKLVRRLSRNFALSDLCTQAARPLRIEKAQRCRKREQENGNADECPGSAH